MTIDLFVYEKKEERDSRGWPMHTPMVLYTRNRDKFEKNIFRFSASGEFTWQKGTVHFFLPFLSFFYIYTTSEFMRCDVSKNRGTRNYNAYRTRIIRHYKVLFFIFQYTEGERETERCGDASLTHRCTGCNPSFRLLFFSVPPSFRREQRCENRDENYANASFDARDVDMCDHIFVEKSAVKVFRTH